MSPTLGPRPHPESLAPLLVPPPSLMPSSPPALYTGSSPDTQQGVFLPWTPDTQQGASPRTPDTHQGASPRTLNTQQGASPRTPDTQQGVFLPRTPDPPQPFMRLRDSQVSPVFPPPEAQKPPLITVGRFQVSPSKEVPAVSHPKPRPLSQATPTTHSPPPSMASKSESSTEEASQSESSIGTVKQSPVRGQEEGRQGGCRLRISQEGPTGSVSQSWSRSTPCISSDESESENKEMWAELLELRDRHQGEVQDLHANQKREIEQLYLRMGKVPPPGIAPPAVMLNQRQRRLSTRKNSLQRAKLLPPAGIMRKNSSSSGSQEPTGRGVTFAPKHS
ncbi:hypothetical protein PBY51_008437 [Eleginops maclovinus]|uniref:Uncharacterized protein n=2 Tax=Eleginops maclovinus TaxID=56733 RepID=A0AAN8AEG1_ELEMC|nr:hypothetical protein PBY51_008437 [Eleginops maclovinus]